MAPAELEAQAARAHPALRRGCRQAV